MDIYAKGQLSFLILNCLLDRDFYGLDILTEVKNRSNGRIELKKPSVYSNFNRMEKQGQVSSYMQSSELGPNRKYYSITEKGRQYYAELKAEFDRLGFDVFRDYVSEEEKPAPAPQTPDTHIFVTEQIPVQAEQDDFFDFSSFTTQSIEPQTLEVVEEVTNENTQPEQVAEAAEKPVETLQETAPEHHDDAVFITNEVPKAETYDEDYNKRLYDITKDFNKYRKRRSFAEDQMAIEETSSTMQDAQDKQQQNLESFKIALLASKGVHDTVAEASEPAPAQPAKTEPAQPILTQTEKAEEPKDDGVFITTRIKQPAPSPVKYEPPKLRVLTENAPLPAPKRDASIDPSHKDIISELYSRSKGVNTPEQTQTSANSESIYDYDDLQDYYRSQNISFRTYTHERSAVKHNTNRLNAVVTGITFALMCIFSAVLFAVLYTKHLTNPNTSFMYIILPGLYFIALCSDLSKLKSTSWEPKSMVPQWFMWLMTALSAGVVVGLNFLCGMSTSNVTPYLTSLILPLALLVALLPFRYYLKRFVYIRYYR